jgi:D-sedoheptulose 7-phosphate isomerase
LTRLASVVGQVDGEALSEVIEYILEARATGRRVYVMGNGGSSATASHFVCDLVKTAQVAGLAPIRAFALADNVPLVTAWANDHAYERIFAEQINALVEDGDVVVGISASGNSPNIVAGLIAAREKGAHTIALVGFDGGDARDLADVAVHVDCHDYGLVEDTHAALGHAIAAALRAALLGD